MSEQPTGRGIAPQGAVYAAGFDAGRASAWDEVADFVETQAHAIYPRDVFLPPSAEDLAAVNALLQRERGHQLDGIAAECMRRAYAGAARLIREGAADRMADTLADTGPPVE